MKEQQLQQAKDWLAQNNYDDNQYVFLNGNSPHGVNKEGQPLESVLANYLLEKEKEKQIMYEGYFNDRPPNPKAGLLFILVFIAMLILAIVNP